MDTDHLIIVMEQFAPWPLADGDPRAADGTSVVAQRVEQSCVEFAEYVQSVFAYRLENEPHHVLLCCNERRDPAALAMRVDLVRRCLRAGSCCTLVARTTSSKLIGLARQLHEQLGCDAARLSVRAGNAEAAMVGAAA